MLIKLCSLFLAVFRLARAEFVVNKCPEGTCKTNRGIEARQDTDYQREGEGDDRVNSVTQRNNGNCHHSYQRRHSCVNRTCHGLIDGHIDKLISGLFLAVKTLIFSDTVIDNDGIVDGVTEDSQHNCHKVCIYLHAADNECAVCHDNIVEKRDNGNNTRTQPLIFLNLNAM